MMLRLFDRPRSVIWPNDLISQPHGLDMEEGEQNNLFMLALIDLI